MKTNLFLAALVLASAIPGIGGTSLRSNGAALADALCRPNETDFLAQDKGRAVRKHTFTDVKDLSIKFKQRETNCVLVRISLKPTQSIAYRVVLHKRGETDSHADPMPHQAIALVPEGSSANFVFPAIERGTYRLTVQARNKSKQKARIRDSIIIVDYAGVDRTPVSGAGE